MSEAKFDSKRRLCPDGSCIGVVGDDGRCKVCGRDAGGGAKSGGGKSAVAAASGLAAVSEATTDDSDLDTGSSSDGDSDGDDTDAMAADAAEPGAPSFDPARRLCSDGNCIGLIGPDGNCNVCGQPASE